MSQAYNQNGLQEPCRCLCANPPLKQGPHHGQHCPYYLPFDPDKPPYNATDINMGRKCGVFGNG